MPNYSTSTEYIKSIVANVWGKCDARVEFTPDSNGFDGLWRFTVDKKLIWEGFAESVPHAICLAALKAKGVSF